MSIGSLHANADFTPLNQIHGVPLITGAEQTRLFFAVDGLQQLTQFSRRLVIERFEQRHMAQRVDGHSSLDNSGKLRLREASIAVE